MSAAALGLTAGAMLTACGGAGGGSGGQPAALGGTLTIYSGRSEKLIGPLLEQFQAETGVEVETRYGATAELAATILEEGKNSPADVFFAQDAGALGAIAAENGFRPLPNRLLQRVDQRFRSPQQEWVGLSGRARVIVYNTDALAESDLPDTIWGFTDPEWQEQLGWPPTNGSFQAFVTALRVLEGDQRAREWLTGINANEPRRYRNNTMTVDAVGKGEILAGFVNHYYLFRFLSEQGDSFPARNYHPRGGGAGTMLNVAGAGVLATAKNPRAAEAIIDFLLSRDAQQYFADQTFEYPLIEGIKTHHLLVPLDQIETPEMDLGDLADLRGTLELLREVGVL